MKDIQNLGTAICAVALIGAGWVSHAGLFPQNPVVETEVEVFVDRVIEVPTEKESYYKSCQRIAYQTYISSWNGELKDGVHPRDIETLIKQCLDYYKN